MFREVWRRGVELSIGLGWIRNTEYQEEYPRRDSGGEIWQFDKLASDGLFQLNKVSTHHSLIRLKVMT